MSCGQSRLSREIEAFISRISADGPSLKRPPHMVLADEKSAGGFPESRLRPSIAFLLAPALALWAAACDRQKPEAPQGEPGAATASAARLPSGTIDRSHAGSPAPSTSFQRPDGTTASLADFRGAPVLVNLWATWCAPCVVEMPSLDRLAASRGDDLQVLALSQDFGGMAKVAPFFEQHAFQALEPYVDSNMAFMTELRLGTLPSTILYDAEGREVWRLTGIADWQGEEVDSWLLEAEAG